MKKEEIKTNDCKETVCNDAYQVEVQKCREEIDNVDKELVKLFEKRMDVAAKVAEVKNKYNKNTLDSAREREKLASVADMARDDMEDYVHVLYSLLMELSSSYQDRLNAKNSDLKNEVINAVENTPKLFPERAIVACQGVEGANSQLACEKLFKVPKIMFVKSFENVFGAVESGMCQYGILPIENSTAGSVNAIYDLMREYRFKIVKSVRVKVNHNLLVHKDAKKSDIKEIYSHEQALSQCEEYLKTFNNVKINVCENTAVAAKMVAESGRKDVAALSSESCAELYGLKCEERAVQDMENNYTRFICISKQLEIYPGAERTSIMMTLKHRPGALYKVLSRFFALGINLVKLESRPMPERDFEFMFYFDLESSVYSDKFIQLICELDELCDEFRYLGSYSEAI